MKFRRGPRREDAPEELPFDIPGLADTPWGELRAVGPGVSAAPVPALVRQLVAGRNPAQAGRSLEDLYRNGGLLAEFVHPLVPVLVGVARAGERSVRSRALEVLADFTHGTPMHGLPGETDVDHELRLREALRSGIDLYYEALADALHTEAALELVFFVEGHSARLEEAMARLPEDGPAVRQTVAWIRNTPSRVDVPLVVGATTTFIGSGKALPVRFGVSAEGEPRVETLTVVPWGGDVYEVATSPLYVRGLARGDRFTVDPSGTVSGVTHSAGGVTIQVQDYDGVTQYLIDWLRREAGKHGGAVDAHDHVRVGLWIPERAAIPALGSELDRTQRCAAFEDWWVANPA